MICAICSHAMNKHYALPAWRCGNPDCTDYDRWYAVFGNRAARVIPEHADPLAALPPGTPIEAR